MITKPATPPEPSRTRVQIDLPPSVSLLLDHVSDVTGSAKSQLCLGAVLDALPGWIDRADLITKRAQALQVKGKGR